MSGVTAVYDSADGLVYPDSWAHRGPAGVNDPGYGWNADGTLAWEIIGNSVVLADCTVFWKKTYTYVNGRIATESGWVKQ